MILLAHQGTATEHSGNTLDAFRWAVRHGATWIETDVWRSSDGHLVCIHDGTIDRTTSSRGPVSAHGAGALSDYGVPSLADACALTLVAHVQDSTGTDVGLVAGDPHPVAAALQRAL